jgi:asparagine synthase (glutamine-hydrolysing)
LCGICGKLNLKKDGTPAAGPVDGELLQRMCDSILHRGPDGEGMYLRGPVGLGHRRLSIIDLATGAQPMSNEDGSIWIVFNGEIYNFQELRAELQVHGHKFATLSDTEVVIHAYEQWGPESCTHLRGMFAYAIWDENCQRLVMARDRLGKKPLVYTHTSEAFLFASEIRALLLDPSVQHRVSLPAIYAYLVRLYVPASQTAFDNIYKLPPAHYLVLENGRLEIKRYWRVDYNQKKSSNYSETEAQEQLWQLLREATRIRLMSEVPLGAFLSGGIDSSAVVGIMSQFMDEPVKTFSINYKEAGYDESSYARQVAQLFKTDHHEFTVRPNAMEVLPALVWHYGEPFADASAIPTYYVSKLTRQYVTVALSGDAGDENFAGYDHYRIVRLLEMYAVIMKLVPGVQGLFQSLLKGLGHMPGQENRMHRLRVVVERGSLTPAEAYLRRSSIFTPELAAQFWQPEALAEAGDGGLLESLNVMLADFRGNDPLDRWLYLDLMNYLPDDILVKVDIASMANSLEVRAPFLDHKLVEFAAGLPPAMKMHGFTTKYILKKTLERILPREILYRPKHGFAVPISEWLQGELSGLLHEVLLDPTALGRGYFHPEQVVRLIQEHESGQMDHGTRLWVLLNLELWHRTYVDEVRQSPLIL